MCIYTIRKLWVQWTSYTAMQCVVMSGCHAGVAHTLTLGYTDVWTATWLQADWHHLVHLQQKGAPFDEIYNDHHNHPKIHYQY